MKKSNLKQIKGNYFFPFVEEQFALPLPDGFPVVLGIFGLQLLVFAIFNSFFLRLHCNFKIFFN